MFVRHAVELQVVSPWPPRSFVKEKQREHNRSSVYNTTTSEENSIPFRSIPTLLVFGFARLSETICFLFLESVCDETIAQQPDFVGEKKANPACVEAVVYSSERARGCSAEQ